MINIFILYALEPETRFFFYSWILIVIVSVVIHELAHGWMAIRLGDTTPIRMGRMTGNPAVHMGGVSLVALMIFGIAWGQMPIDPTRLRGKYAEAKVALAGPVSNLLIALCSLTALGLLIRFAPNVNGQWQENLHEFLFLAGSANILLAVYNLVPIPPFDGSHILANFHRGYARFISDPSKQGFFMLCFFAMFWFFGEMWGHAYAAAEFISTSIATLGG